MTELKALTSLRFFAAAMIVIQHLGGLPGWNLSAGVSIFFVLSGFILAYRYPTLDTWRDRRRFWLKRFARIWPAHAVATLLVLFIAPSAITDLSPDWMLAALAENLAMVQSWTPVKALNYSINGPSWSISTEAFFYLAFPALILSFSRSWWWKLALSGLVVVVFVFLYRFMWPTTDLYTLFYCFPLVRIFEFLVGMIAAFAWMRCRERIRWSLLTGTAIEGAATLFLVIYLAYSFGLIPAYLGNLPEGALIWVWMSSGALVPSTVIIIVLALRRGLISVALSWWPFVLLGELSYSIYLLHAPLIRSHYFESTPALLIAILAASAAVFWLIERPARTAISQIGSKRERRKLPDVEALHAPHVEAISPAARAAEHPG